MISARAARRDRFRRTLKFSQAKHNFLRVIICYRMSCTLQRREKPIQGIGGATNPCRCSKILDPRQSCCCSEPCIYSADIPQPHCLQARKIWEESTLDELLSEGSIHTGAVKAQQQGGSCSNSRHREESQEQPQLFIYQYFCVSHEIGFSQSLHLPPRESGLETFF